MLGASHRMKPYLLGHVYLLFIIINKSSVKSKYIIIVTNSYFESISSGVELAITSGDVKTKDDARASG
jgi:hypothetical protein